MEGEVGDTYSQERKREKSRGGPPCVVGVASLPPPLPAEYQRLMSCFFFSFGYLAEEL